MSDKVFLGEIAPPAEAVQREIYERTGIAIGRRFAVMRDGERTGQIGIITAVSAVGVAWRTTSEPAERQRESVEVVSDQRVAWWIGP